jgi:toluene monooxygenase system protein D
VSSKDISTAHLNNRVGPVLRQGSLAKAVAEAAEVDNPDRVIAIDDKVAYVRISTDGEMILRRATIEEMLGQPFQMRDLEVELSSFSGRIDNAEEYIRFYFEKTF